MIQSVQNVFFATVFILLCYFFLREASLAIVKFGDKANQGSFVFIARETLHKVNKEIFVLLYVQNASL